MIRSTAAGALAVTAVVWVLLHDRLAPLALTLVAVSCTTWLVCRVVEDARSRAVAGSAERAALAATWRRTSAGVLVSFLLTALVMARYGEPTFVAACAGAAGWELVRFLRDDDGGPHVRDRLTAALARLGSALPGRAGHIVGS